MEKFNELVIKLVRISMKVLVGGIMSETRWTTEIKRIIRNKGEQAGFNVDKQFEERLNINGLKIQPDVIWRKENRVRCVFEIDTFSNDYYAKTIFGSILGGIIMARVKDAEFIEIVKNRTHNGSRAEQMIELIKRYLGSLPKIHCILVPEYYGRFRYENTQKFLTKKFQNEGII